MASSNPPKVSALQKIVQNHLECGICYEQYTDPRVLDCLHSFCKTCLQKYQSTNYKDATMLICPVCRKKTKLHQKDVQALKTNFNITGLADQLKLVSLSEDNHWVCKLCKYKNEATHFCFDCPAIFCANCYKVHQKSHTVNTLKDISDGKIASKDRKPKRRPECQTHEGEVMWFYCTTCDVMICQVCTVIDHCKPQHEYIDCNQASSTYKQSLAQLFTPLEETMKKLEQSQATASTMKDNLNIAAKRTMAEVKKRADEIRAEVTAQERRIMDEIQTILKDRSRKLEEFEQAVRVNLQQIQQSLQNAKDVSKNSLAPDFLAVYSTISQDLKGLRDQNQPKIDLTLSHLRFTPGVCDISLGNLIKEPRWELCLEYDKGINGAVGIDASIPGDEMAVANYGNSRVVIYDTTGHQKKTIDLPRGPFAVAAFKNQLVIVDGTNPVKMYNRNGNKMFEFHTVPHSEVGKTTVYLRSVAVIKDTIMVGDWKRSVITKHRSSDGSLIDTVTVQTKPWYLAIDSKDRVVVSGSSQQQVDIVGVDGGTLVSINPKINSQPVGYCGGVCCDSSAIYIAVSNGVGTGHIHRYDTRGRFLSCIAQGLYNPWGISLTSDGQQLAVADNKSVKIYNKVEC
ncbi:E3 ubiquitin-protein ligase TRIM56-like [Asterias rubens]|uniref:E3 ubiquitin-protein ligase TRIM56-like n=1 Tax=Asterias rubens TaxID=7604 RepID=UPI0014551DE8|nr:E3 ubiquitin-protein ligase TRIM56-like [Asterias rubens]